MSVGSRFPPCSGCGDAAVTHIERAGACASCLARVCHAVLGDWGGWFAVPSDGSTPSAEPPFDATTHSDLATAFAEMGLEADALFHGVVAIAADAHFAETHGERVLRSLGAAGWTRLGRLGRLN